MGPALFFLCDIFELAIITSNHYVRTIAHKEGRGIEITVTTEIDGNVEHLRLKRNIAVLRLRRFIVVSDQTAKAK